MAEHQIAYFLRELHGAADPARRAAAAKGLGRTGRPEHAAVLARAAGDPEPAVRAAAAAGLARLAGGDGSPRVRGAAAEALPALLADGDPQVRRRASLAALRLGLDGPRITDAFARLLTDPDRHVRINALTALHARGVPGDAAAVAGLLGDPDPTVRGLARALLYRCADDPAVAAHVLRTAREGEGAARVEAMAMVPARCTGALLDSLLTGLRDPSARVRTAVAARLASVDTATARDALAAALDDEPDPHTAAVLLRGAARRGDPRAAAAALRWLTDPVAGPAAAHALGRLDTPGAAERLRSALDDGTLPAPVRAAAAVAVAEGGGWDAVWLLLPLLDDEDPALRTGALDALGVLVERGLRLWERHTVAWALTAHLESGQDTWPTRNALRGLGQALPGLRRLADRAPDGEVRAAALSLLDADGDTAPQDLRRFVTGLDDPDEAVRYQAATALHAWMEATGELPPDSGPAHERLSRLATTDTSPRTRHAATEALTTLAALTTVTTRETPPCG
ncbi:HEAT repeat domain-containing protein [Streptomyces sp. NPDC052687]|uniref:HEAT repeat domain-containing protein n=1 Tax=Streptomyces sp. NPDC052687 TaxID=3154759 RepID=UPI00341C2AEA